MDTALRAFYPLATKSEPRTDWIDSLMSFAAKQTARFLVICQFHGRSSRTLKEKFARPPLKT
jgi:hypothetical protein